MKRRVGAAAGLLVLLLSACGGSNGSDSALALPAKSTCTDRAGDGVSGVDLRKVTIDGNRITWDMDGYPPSGAWASLAGIEATSADGKVDLQFVVKWSGSEANAFVYNVSAGTAQTNVGGDEQIGRVGIGGVVTQTFPEDEFAKLGPNYSWTAGLGVNADDGDQCSA